MSPKPPWTKGKHRRRWQEGDHPTWNRFFFVRFLLMLISFSVLVFGGLSLITFRLATWLTGNEDIALQTWMQACSLAIIFPLMAGVLARRVFKRTMTPVAEILTAVTEVAEGDLSVTLPDYGRGDFGDLGRAFNQMVAKLSTSEQQRRNLTADVAHELRTPLHIIQGNLEGIIDGVYEPDQAHIEATLEETQALSRLVSDLQTLTLAEAGQLALVQEPVNIAELLGDVRTSFSGQTEVAGIALSLSLPDGADHWELEGDNGRLNQVLSILLMNAIRHTPAGGQITLAAAKEAENYIIKVSDSGEGISPEELPHIFNRFWRGDKARTHGQGTGAGLGLSIAQQLVLAHAGSIEVSSELSQGTSFQIRLPA